MAIKTKAGKVYKDKYSAVGNSDHYAVIDKVIVDKKNGYADFALKIYKNKAARNSSQEHIEKIRFITTETEFNEYFAVGNKHKDQFTAAYLCLAGRREESTRNEEDEEVLGDLVWKDWESDE